MIDIPGIYVGRFKDDPNQSTMFMKIGDTPTYTDDNWANVESTGTIWRYSSEAGEWIDTGLEEILVEEVSGTKEIVAEGTVLWKLQGLNVYGKSTQDGTPSPDNPISIVSAGASGRIETNITGKNLLAGRLYYGVYSSDTPYIQNENKVNLPYNPTGALGICYAIPVAKKNTTYTFSVTNPNTNARLFLGLYRAFEDTFHHNRAISHKYGIPTVSITASEDGILVCLIAGIWTNGNTTIHECTESELLQLEIGSTATAYEAPHSQSIVATTPNGLPGIPVSSGGNYTDADGQQWVCDEVDFERGVYMQRIQKILSYSDENVLSPYMSTTGQLTTGATVIYVLAAPIETPLSAEELAAYAALMSYDGSTVISTDEDVSGISAKVVTDVISKNAWFDPYAELALYYKALAGFESLDNLPMPHSRESSLVRKLLDSSYELGFSVNENSSRNERYLWDLINGTSTMLTNVPKSDTEKFLHVMIGGTVEEYPVVDTELDYWMDKCVHYMNSNGNIGG